MPGEDFLELALAVGAARGFGGGDGFKEEGACW